MAYRRITPVRRIRGYAACASLLLLPAVLAPSEASAAWHVRTLDGGRRAALGGLASLPGGHTAVLFDSRRGGRHRLALQRPDEPALTLMTGTHTFGTSLGTDAKGHVAVAWTTIPPGGRFRRAYLWTGGRVRALTDGTRHAEAALAVSPSGDLAVAVTDGTTSRAQGATWVQRGSFRDGLSSRRQDLGGLQTVYPGALRFSPANGLAAGGFAIRPDGPNALAGTAVVVSPGPKTGFGAAAFLPPPPTPAGQQSLPDGPAVGFGPRGEVVAATSTLRCTIGTGDLGGECGKLISSTVRVWRWPVAGPGPGAPTAPGTATFAQMPAIVTSGSATWLTWLEGATYRPTLLAAVRIGTSRLGAVRHLRLTPEEQQVTVLPVAVAPAANGALRFYLPAPGRPTSALDTVRMSRDGRFGSRATVVRGSRYAGANTVALPVLATGAVRDLVGWTTWENGPFARMATP